LIIPLFLPKQVKPAEEIFYIKKHERVKEEKLDDVLQYDLKSVWAYLLKQSF